MLKKNRNPPDVLYTEGCVHISLLLQVPTHLFPCALIHQDDLTLGN